MEKSSLYRSVGTLDMKDRRFSFGLPSSEQFSFKYSILDIHSKRLIESPEMISLNYDLIPESKMGVQGPHIQDDENGYENFLTGKDITIYCSGTDINLHGLTPSIRGVAWGWRLFINHQIDEDVLSKLGIKRAWLYQGMESLIGKTEVISPHAENTEIEQPSLLQQKKNEVLDTQYLDENSPHLILPKWHSKSLIRGVVVLTDQELSRKLIQLGTELQTKLDISLQN